MTLSTLKKILTSLILLAALVACGVSYPTPATASPTSAATEISIAAQVNDEAILMTEFEDELARFQAAQAALGSAIPTAESTQRVLDDLINQVLLAQGARAARMTVDDATLQAHVDALAAQTDLAAWLAANGYTDETFRLALRRQLEAARMRDQIITAVPGTAEQVHIRQILLYNGQEAQQVLAQLNSGADFEELAAAHDPLTRGDLGWFPRGYLPEPQIEEAAFALQAGQYSGVIMTSMGFHIIMLIARDPQRPLTPDALLVFQEKALTDWLNRQRATSTIVLAP